MPNQVSWLQNLAPYLLLQFRNFEWKKKQEEVKSTEIEQRKLLTLNWRLRNAKILHKPNIIYEDLAKIANLSWI